jgi:hypothetical protein
MHFMCKLAGLVSCDRVTPTLSLIDCILFPANNHAFSVHAAGVGGVRVHLPKSTPSNATASDIPLCLSVTDARRPLPRGPRPDPAHLSSTSRLAVSIDRVEKTNQASHVAEIHC